MWPGLWGRDDMKQRAAAPFTTVPLCEFSALYPQGSCSAHGTSLSCASGVSRPLALVLILLRACVCLGVGGAR